MRLLTFIGITLLAGIISGLAYGSINLLAIEPFIDQAIEIENQNFAREGGAIDTDSMNNYRTWQKGGEVLAGTILGMSFASLYAIVYGYTRKALPGSTDVRKSLSLALIVWLTIFTIPFMKYPGNPPAVGDPETIYYRQSLYMAFVAISGLGALGFAFLYKKLSSMKGRKVIIPALYAAYVAGFFFIMPPNPDTINVPMELVTNFRLTSVTTMAIFWIILGITFGTLWSKFRLHVGMHRTMD